MGGVEEIPEFTKGQKDQSISNFNIQISKERYPRLQSLIPWRTDVPKFDACTQSEYSVNEQIIEASNIMNFFHPTLTFVFFHHSWSTFCMKQLMVA